jgi:hypothetical protein
MAALMTRRASWKLGLQRTLFAAILVTFALGFLAAWAQGPKSSPPNTDDPTQPGYVSGGSGNSSGAPQRARRNLTEADRARLLQSIEEQLAQMACKDRSRKSPTDFFVVSMIDAQGQRASVDYRVIQGLKETAAAVADFLAGAAAGSVRDWEPLARVKSEKAGQRQIELAKAQSIEGRLERFPLSGRGKKSPDDVFVVGTAELRLSDRHADVRFQAMRGTSDVAGFLVAYILGAPEKTERQWHVFVRLKSDAEGETFLAELRRQYDAAESYRSTIALIYRAKTTRRC